MGSIETETNGVGGFNQTSVVPNICKPQPKTASYYGSHRSNWVPVSEHAAFTPRKLRVVCIGAGYSGLMLAHKYKYETPMTDYIDLKIYEKNGDVGGTWLENRYPGVACDVSSRGCYVLKSS